MHILILNGIRFGHRNEKAESDKRKPVWGLAGIVRELSISSLWSLTSDQRQQIFKKVL